MKRKPLMTFVKEECANYVRDNCMGLTPRNEKFRDFGVCWLQEGEEQKPCSYFRGVVFPVANWRGIYDDIYYSYKDIDLTLKRKKIRSCECGTTLPKGKQFCDKCREKKKRNAKYEK
jgi:hypothetical protein